MFSINIPDSSITTDQNQNLLCCVELNSSPVSSRLARNDYAWLYNYEQATTLIFLFRNNATIEGDRLEVVDLDFDNIIIIIVHDIGHDRLIKRMQVCYSVNFRQETKV